jgi:hypothetical protein
MTRVNLENNRARGLVIESAMLFNSEVLAISAALTLVAGLPHAIMLDPASTGRTITLYTPAVTSLVHRHELWNISTGTGVLTLVQVDGTTQVALVPPGQRVELYWNPKLLLWQGYVQNSGQANNQSVAAQQTIQQYTTLAALANAQVMSLALPYAFKLVSVGFRTRVVASTAAKAATLTGQVNGVSVTGGVVSLTTANQNTSGGLTAGTSVTAGNTGTAGQTVGVVVSGVTAFVEGDGFVEYVVTNTNLNA